MHAKQNLGYQNTCEDILTQMLMKPYQRNPKVLECKNANSNYCRPSFNNAKNSDYEEQNIEIQTILLKTRKDYKYDAI